MHVVVILLFVEKFKMYSRQTQISPKVMKQSKLYFLAASRFDGRNTGFTERAVGRVVILDLQ
jgi:hypothetical protein